MLFVPSPCSLLFYKNKAKSYGAFQQVASYVFDKEPTVYSRFESAEKNFECTKRPMIMNLWVLWALHGRALFANKIEYLCRLASQAYAVLESEADFETLHFPESNILCFRYTPQYIPYKHVADFQVKIRNHVSDEGRFFISKVDIKGEPALRVVFMNHDITMAHFQLLLQTIRHAGQHIIHTHQQNKPS
jgi:L-2,4-diaminobutyrate decarboxylase